MQTIIHRYLLMTAMLAIIVSCLLAFPAGATEIGVWGNVSRPGGYLDPNDPGDYAFYGPDITSTQPSLSGSAILGGSLGLVSSSGDLATGELKIFNQSDPAYQRDGIFFGGSVGGNSVWMRETIHILGNIASPVTGILTAELKGTLVPDAVYEAFTGGASAAAFFQLSVNSDYGPFSQYDFQTTGCPPGGVAGTQSCVNTTTINTQVSVSFVISDTARDFDIYAGLVASSFGGGVVDLSHTASLRLTLPAGLTFTSDSGVFLSKEKLRDPEWCSPGFWRNNALKHGASMWPVPTSLTFFFKISPGMENLLFPDEPRPALKKGAPSNPTMLDILQAPQTYGADAFNWVATFLSLNANLYVTNPIVHNCPLEQQ